MTGALGRAAGRVVLGVDLGTSSVKCVVVEEGRIRASGAALLTVDNPHPGWSEQDPAVWCTAATEAIRQALHSADLSGRDVAGLGLSGQMHGAVVLDGQGRPLRPAILWNDNRSSDACLALAAAVPNIGDIAGIAPLPGFTAPKLMWMRRNEPDLFARIRSVLLPKDYLALWLTGELGTDRSDAAGTLWLDQRARAWSEPLTVASGIDAAWLPTLKDGFEPVGGLRADIAQKLGLASGLTVFAGGGDAATGALALGAATPGRCMISLGTSGQLLVVDATYQPEPSKFVHAFCHTVPDIWYRMAAMLNGARPLAWFAQVLGTSVDEVLIRSQAADSARVPLFLPYLTGERSPHGDPAIRSGFYGLEDATGAPEMARAVVEAVAFSMANALESFGPETRLSAPIPVIGGGSRSDVVLQALADVLRQPIARANAGQGGAALGAALLAEVGAGCRTTDELSFDPILGPCHEPGNVPGLLDRLSRYNALYRTLRPFAATP